MLVIRQQCAQIQDITMLTRVLEVIADVQPSAPGKNLVGGHTTI
jgi:hypothetical protein